MPKICIQFRFQFWLCSFGGKLPIGQLFLSIFRLNLFFLDKHLRCPKFVFNFGFSFDFIHFEAGTQMKQDFLWNFRLNLFSSISFCDAQNLCSILVSVLIMFILGPTPNELGLSLNFQVKSFFLDKHLRCPKFVFNFGFSYDFVHFGAHSETGISLNFQVKPFFSLISIWDAQNILVSILILFILGQTHSETGISLNFQVKPFFPR